jgi:protein TonB
VIRPGKKNLERNLDPDMLFKNGAPVGAYKVYVQYLVDKDGTITNTRALTSLGHGMETEIIRTLKKSGAWEPATINGRPVKAYRKPPVTFEPPMKNLLSAHILLPLTTIIKLLLMQVP